jgi:CrcB protein
VSATIAEDGCVSWPIDPDVDAAEAAGPRKGASPFDHARPPRSPRLRWDVVLAVFLGGCVGGGARYAITQNWTTPAGRFPWATFGVNVAGAFILAIVIVFAADVVPSRYLRPLLGTGFCGALTTFSAVVVTTDLLFAHHHQGTAAAYLAASILAGLAAASLGLVLGRAIAAGRRREHRKGSPS